MAFATNTKTFDTIFGQTGEASPVDFFLDEISRYLKTKSSVKFAEAMSASIDKREPMSVFVCREDLVYDMSDEMLDENVPHVVVSAEGGKYGFLVLQKDLESIDRIKAVLLSKKSGICKTVSGKEYSRKKAMAKSADKSVLAISGLSDEKAYLLKQKMGEYFDVAEIGWDKMQDRTNTLYFDGKESVKKSVRDGVDMCRIFLEASIELDGSGGQARTAVALLEQEFENSLMNNFARKGVNLSKTNLYIVGAGTQYVRISGTGFEYGHIVLKDKRPAFSPEFKADGLQPDYRQLLTSYTSRIPRKIMTYDNAEALRCYYRATQNSEARDLRPSDRERISLRASRKLSSMIDEMVKIKISGDQEMTISGKWDEKFKHYCNEASYLLTEMAAHRTPIGYGIDDIKSLRALAETYGFEIDDYKKAVKELREAEIYLLTSEIERIVDIEELVEHIQAAEKQRQEERREERARRRGGGAR